MTRPTTIPALVLAVLLPLATSAGAQGVSLVVAPAVQQPLTGQRADVARALPRYGYAGVDVARLGTGQVAHIAHLIHSGKSEGDIRGHIGATLRRGLLQRGLDRVLR